MKISLSIKTSSGELNICAAIKPGKIGGYRIPQAPSVVGYCGGIPLVCQEPKQLFGVALGSRREWLRDGRYQDSGNSARSTRLR
jgi:hypothetical protein